MHEAFLADDTEKLGVLYSKPSLPENIRAEIGNASKVRNRNAIVAAVSKLVPSLGRMPSPIEISIETGLSITSVYKHLRELKSQELEEEEMLILNAQRTNLLGIIIKAALPAKGRDGREDKEGDPKAAKMALDIINGFQSQAATTINFNNVDFQTLMQAMLTLPRNQQQLLRKNMIAMLPQDDETKNGSVKTIYITPGNQQSKE